MSKHTIARIPGDVLEIFKIFLHASRHFSALEDVKVFNHVRQSSVRNQIVHRSRLLGFDHSKDPLDHFANTHDVRNFSPILNRMISPIFDRRPRGERKFIFLRIMAPNDEDPLLRVKSGRNFTNRQAQILTGFASFYSPTYSIASNSISSLSYQWFRRAIRHTPLIIFLKQSHSLLGTESLLEADPFVDLLQSKLDDLRARYNEFEDPRKRSRNYHLTNLSQIDIFGLALGVVQVREHIRAKLGIIEPSKGINDDLYKSLWKQFEPRIFCDTMQPMESGDPKVSDALNSMDLDAVKREISQLLDPSEVQSLVPLDLRFNQIYMLTIEPSIIEDNHLGLIKALESIPELEIVAARLSRSWLPSLGAADKGRNGSTYDDLIQSAKSSRAEGDGLAEVLRALASLGLVKVEETAGAGYALLRH